MIELPEATVHYSKCSLDYTKEQMLSYGKQCAVEAIKSHQDNLGCTRSHPHEDMSVECALKAEIAWLRNQLETSRTKLSSLKEVGYLIPCKEVIPNKDGWFTDIDKPPTCFGERLTLFAKVLHNA